MLDLTGKKISGPAYHGPIAESRDLASGRYLYWNR
jgi:hypothetical protein